MSKSAKLLNSLKTKLLEKGIELIEKPWETSLLQLNVFSINFLLDKMFFDRSDHACRLKLELNWLIESLIEAKPCMLVAKIPSGNQFMSSALEKNGFRLMECYLEFQHTLQNIPHATGKHKIISFRKSDIKKIEGIAYHSFNYSRFHIDPLIDGAVANRTRAEWIKNACHGEADTVFTSLKDNEPIGFIACKSKKNNKKKIGVLDLIAVLPEYRNQHIGYDLTIQFLDYCSRQQYNSAEVGTQAHNIASIRMYNKIGFSIYKSSYTYHIHIR